MESVKEIMEIALSGTRFDTALGAVVAAMEEAETFHWLSGPQKHECCVFAVRDVLKMDISDRELSDTISVVVALSRGRRAINRRRPMLPGICWGHPMGHQKKKKNERTNEP
jgi:hypothetical protein